MDAKKVYLVAYNGFMFTGWGLILYRMARHLLVGETIHMPTQDTVATVYPVIEKMLVVFQTGAVAEVLHSLFGLVRSPVFTTFAQVLSRLIVLYGALEIGPTSSRSSVFLVQMVTAWCLSEIIRYSFYAFNLMGRTPSFLVWLRYSAFLILYPMGISGELMVMYKALPYIKESGRWSVDLPNTMNVVFNWPMMMWFIMVVVYPPASKVLYTYMLSQRRKVLGKKGKSSKKD